MLSVSVPLLDAETVPSAHPQMNLYRACRGMPNIPDSLDESSRMPQQQTVFPIIVPLGFAGSRHILPPDSGFSAAEAEEFITAIERHLTEAIQQLPVELGMSDQHVLCGISQVAIGADAIFTRVCAALTVPQRMFTWLRRVRRACRTSMHRKSS